MEAGTVNLTSVSNTLTQVHPPQGRDDFRVAIICALPLEAACVQAAFDKFWDHDTKSYGKVSGDPNAYTTGVMGEHNVVLAHLPTMGKVSASQVAASLHISFPSIELVAVVGICGATPLTWDTGKDIFLGDVIIGEALVQYDFGKRYPHRFEMSSSTQNDSYRLDSETRAILAKLKTHQHRVRMGKSISDFTAKILERLPDVSRPDIDTDKVYEPSYVHRHHRLSSGQECAKCYESENAVCPDALKMTCDALGCDTHKLARSRSHEAQDPLVTVHIGKIGSGDTVMKSGEDRDRIAEELGVIAFEMEGAGVGAQVSSIVIKGVCDYADSHKHKLWQGYAASTAAACFKAFLRHWAPKRSSVPAARSTFSLPSWLVAPDPSSNYRTALKLREPETGSWFLNSLEYDNWRCCKRSSLWIYGIPGCGKTVLSAAIVEDITQHCQQSNGLVAYFYFDFKDSQKQGIDFMLKSLILQLVQNRDKFSPNLEFAFPTGLEKLIQPSTDVLMECLKKLIGNAMKVFLVIDALDESIDPPGVADILRRVANWNSAQLLITSRRDREIQDILDEVVDRNGSVHLQASLVDQDIRRFVRGKLATDRRLAKWSKIPDLCREIEVVLTDKADGMFRLAACQLDDLAKCLTRSHVRTALKSLPTTLDQTYDRILSSIDSDHYVLVHRILQWLVFSERPLALDEVAEVAAIDLDRHIVLNREDVLEDPLDVLTICSSLVTTIATRPYLKDLAVVHRSAIGNSTFLRRLKAASMRQKGPGMAVILAHHSVREYLLSDRLRWGELNKYSIQAGPSNEFIARACLACLSQILNQDQPGGGYRLTNWKLTDYAALYWERHARAAAPDNKDLIQIVLEFLSPENYVFLDWLRHYNPETKFQHSSMQPFMSKDTERSSYRNHDIPGPLYFASLLGLLGVVQHLLTDRALDPNNDIGTLGTPLQAAAYGGFLEATKALIEHGANVQARDDFYGGALIAAVAKRHEKIVDALLNAGADVNFRDRTGDTVLHFAVRNGDLAVIQKLLDFGASLSIKNGRGRTAVDFASDLNQRTVITTLMDHQVSKGPVNGATKLHLAAWLGQTHILQELIQAGHKVDALDDNNATPLHYAAKNSQEAAVLALLEVGANPEISGTFWGSALQIACNTGLKQAVRMMLELVVDVNMSRSIGVGMPLLLATKKGHKEIVQMLIEHGVDPRFRILYQRTALDIALDSRYTEIAELLREALAQF